MSQVQLLVRRMALNMFVSSFLCATWFSVRQPPCFGIKGNSIATPFHRQMAMARNIQYLAESCLLEWAIGVGGALLRG
jgi:hypothetical protein